MPIHFGSTAISKRATSPLFHQADPATIKLMGYPQTLRGHVNGSARAITVADAQPDQVELASVNPIFTLGAPSI
jgi:hypothetical protein